MMIDQLDGYLHQMGLSEYESSVYLTLLRQGTSTAREIYTTSDIPQSRVYDVVESLEEKGVVRIQQGRPKKFGPVQPQLAVQHVQEYLQTKQTEQLTQVQAAGEQFLEGLNESQFKNESHKDVDIFWSFEGKSYILEKGEQLLENTDSEYRLVTTASSFERLVNYHGELIRDKYDQGVSVRVLLRMDNINKVVLEAASRWADIRPIEQIEGRFYLYDSDRTLIAFRNDDSDGFIGLVTHNSQLSNTLSYIFEVLWENAEPQIPSN